MSPDPGDISVGGILDRLTGGSDDDTSGDSGGSSTDDGDTGGSAPSGRSPGRSDRSTSGSSGGGGGGNSDPPPSFGGVVDDVADEVSETVSDATGGAIPDVSDDDDGGGGGGDGGSSGGPTAPSGRSPGRDDRSTPGDGGGSDSGGDDGERPPMFGPPSDDDGPDDGVTGPDDRLRGGGGGVVDEDDPGGGAAPTGGSPGRDDRSMPDTGGSDDSPAGTIDDPDDGVTGPDDRLSGGGGGTVDAGDPGVDGPPVGRDPGRDDRTVPDLEDGPPGVVDEDDDNITGPDDRLSGGGGGVVDEDDPGGGGPPRGRVPGRDERDTPVGDTPSPADQPNDGQSESSESSPGASNDTPPRTYEEPERAAEALGWRDPESPGGTAVAMVEYLGEGEVSDEDLRQWEQYQERNPQLVKTLSHGPSRNRDEPMPILGETDARIAAGNQLLRKYPFLERGDIDTTVTESGNVRATVNDRLFEQELERAFAGYDEGVLIERAPGVDNERDIELLDSGEVVYTDRGRQSLYAERMGVSEQWVSVDEDGDPRLTSTGLRAASRDEIAEEIAETTPFVTADDIKRSDLAVAGTGDDRRVTGLTDEAARELRRTVRQKAPKIGPGEDVSPIQLGTKQYEFLDLSKQERERVKQEAAAAYQQRFDREGLPVNVDAEDIELTGSSTRTGIQPELDSEMREAVIRTQWAQQGKDVDRLEFNDEGEVVNVDPDTNIVPDSGGGIFGTVANTFEERVADPFAAGGRWTNRNIVDPASGVVATGVGRGAGAASVAVPGLSGETAEQVAGSATDKFLGGGTKAIVGTVGNLGNTALMAGKVGGEAAEFTVENPTEAPGAAAGATTNYAIQQGQYMASNPIKTAGTLAVSAGVMGGAAKLSPRAGTAARWSIQPGEELLGFGGNTLLNRAPTNRDLGDTLFPNNEPLIFSEEAAIRGTKSAARRARQQLGRARKATQNVGDADGGGISIEADPEAGRLEIDQELKDALRESPSRTLGATGNALDAVGRVGIETETPDANADVALQQHYIRGSRFPTGASPADAARRALGAGRRAAKRGGESVDTLMARAATLTDSEADTPVALQQHYIRGSRFPTGDVGPTDVGQVLKQGAWRAGELTGTGVDALMEQTSWDVSPPGDVTLQQQLFGGGDGPSVRQRLKSGVDTLGELPSGDRPDLSSWEARGRREATAARFRAAETLGETRARLGALRDLSVKIGDPDIERALSTDSGDWTLDVEDSEAASFAGDLADELGLDDATESESGDGGRSGGGASGDSGGWETPPTFESSGEAGQGVLLETEGEAAESGESGNEAAQVFKEDPNPDAGAEIPFRTQPLTTREEDQAPGVSGLDWESASPRRLVETTVEAQEQQAGGDTLGLLGEAAKSQVRTASESRVRGREALFDPTTDVVSELRAELGIAPELEPDTETTTEARGRTDAEQRLGLESELEAEQEMEMEMEMRSETESRRETEKEDEPEDTQRGRNTGGNPSSNTPATASGRLSPGWLFEYTSALAGVDRGSPGQETLEEAADERAIDPLPTAGALESEEEFEAAAGFFMGEGIGVDILGDEPDDGGGGFFNFGSEGGGLL